MLLETIIEKKSELETNIRTEILKFEKETKTVITSIEVDRIFSTSLGGNFKSTLTAIRARVEIV